MAQTEGQRRAAEAVGAEMARRGLSNADLSAVTGEQEDAETPVDVGTIGDFLKGARWPRATTLSRFERALEWEVGSLVRYARGGPHPAASKAAGSTEQPDRGLRAALSEVDDHDLLAEVARRMARHVVPGASIDPATGYPVVIARQPEEAKPPTVE